MSIEFSVKIIQIIQKMYVTHTNFISCSNKLPLCISDKEITYIKRGIATIAQMHNKIRFKFCLVLNFLKKVDDSEILALK